VANTIALEWFGSGQQVDESKAERAEQRRDRGGHQAKQAKQEKQAKWEKIRQWRRDARETDEFDGGHRTSIPLNNLFELFACRLDGEEANILLLHAAYMAGEGPPPHEVLEVSRKRARRMLLNAQDALFALTRG
jgi:hypothetical protein